MHAISHDSIACQATRSINSAATMVETSLKCGACLPFVGVIASVAKLYLGHGQVVLGAATAAVGLVGLGISHIAPCSNHTKKEWNMVTRLGIEHTIHGALNVLSSLGEIILAVSTSFIGNPLLLLIYYPNDFKPLFPYGSMTSHY